MSFGPGQGGVPIIVGGEVIGAVGVSGSAPEHDHEWAMAAVKGLGL